MKRMALWTGVAAVAATTGAWTASGETITDLSGYVYQKATDYSSGYSSFVHGHNWSDGLPPHDDADYIVQGAKQLRTDHASSTATFGGRSLSLDNGYLNLKVSGANFTIGDLRLYNGCRIWNGNASSAQTIRAQTTVYGTEENPPLLGIPGSSRTTILKGSLIGNEDAVLKVAENPGDTAPTADHVGYAIITSTNENGNCGTYFGRFFSFTRYAYLVVDRVETLGAGDTAAHGSVLTLQNGGGFLGNGGLIFTNAAYSISINGNGTLGAYAAGPANLDLPLGGSTAGLYLGGGVEIKGVNGNDTLEIWNKGAATALNDVRLSGIAQIAISGGTVRFLSDYNAPEIPVTMSSGRIAIAGWCENIGDVTLASGNSLTPGVGQKVVGTLGMKSLTMANGAFIIASIYQQEDNSVTSDLIRVEGNLTKGTEPVEIQFDCFPAGTNGTIKAKLLTAANLGTAGGLTVNDFSWRMQDDYLANLVTGELSIEEENGTNYLFFTRTSNALVYLAGVDSGSSSGSSFDRGTNWENKAAPDAEHDYVVPRNMLLRCYIHATPFQGRSLSILGGGDFSICGVTASVNDLRAYPGARFSTRVSNADNRLTGNLYVYATESSPLDFMIEGGASARQLTLGSRLVGGNDAMVRFRCYTKGPAVGSDTFTGGKFIITGDNSDYKGKITIHQNTIVAEFASEAALGGPADAFSANRLTLSSNSVFRCNSTFTLSDPTRGITLVPPDNLAHYTYGGGSFEVTEGNTLTIRNVITGEGSFRKTGAGTLVLDATNTLSGVIQPKEGKLVVRNARALGTGKVKCFADGILRIETADGVTLDPDSPFNTDVDSVLNVELAAFDAPSAGKVEANIFTLSQAETFDASAIQIVNGGLGDRYKVEILTRQTDAGLQVYAVAKRRGLTISIR